MKNVKKRKKRDINKKRKKRFFTSMDFDVFARSVSATRTIAKNVQL